MGDKEEANSFPLYPTFATVQNIIKENINSNFVESV